MTQTLVPYDDKDRHEAIISELAGMFGLKVTKKLKKFYYSTYHTAVTDVADEGEGMTREQIIENFAPKRKKSKRKK